MKILISFLLVLTFAENVFPDNYITKGPAIGEIYFIGTTYTGTGIYYSTDFGETAILMDSSIMGNLMAISADKSPGVLYYVTNQIGIYSDLYMSNNYGQQGSWIYRNDSIRPLINSGRHEGEIYSSCTKHSIDYGNNFVEHNITGFFGNRKDVEIDNVNSDIGYVLVSSYSTTDTLYLLFTNDNFENLEIVNSFNLLESNYIILSSGNNEGELFFFNRTFYSLYYSNNYAGSFHLNEYYNLLNNCNITGGRQEGELYIIMYHINMMWQDAHTYILYSTDYGITFEVFHPFAKGQPPLLANFSGITDTNNTFSKNQIPKYGGAPLDVQFHNYSIGDINSHEWDFEDDGIIDSYEENPLHTYTDTGYYSVRLTVYDDFDTNSFLKENYIYVDNTTFIENEISDARFLIKNYPNPVRNHTIFEFQNANNINIDAYIEIFDLRGNPVNRLPIQKNVKWNRKDFNGQFVTSGIYLYKLSLIGSEVYKMILY